MPKNKTKAQLRKERNRAAASVADAKKKEAKTSSKKAQELAEQGERHIRQQYSIVALTHAAVLQAQRPGVAVRAF